MFVPSKPQKVCFSYGKGIVSTSRPFANSIKSRMIFLCILGSFCNRFRIISRSFWYHFGLILGSFWGSELSWTPSDLSGHVLYLLTYLVMLVAANCLPIRADRMQNQQKACMVVGSSSIVVGSEVTGACLVGTLRFSDKPKGN